MEAKHADLHAPDTIRSVADVAYLFIRRHLTPSRKLALPIQISEVILEDEIPF